MSTKNSNQTCALVSAKELSRLLSTSVRSIWRYRSAHCLPEPVQISGAIRWKLEDIRLFLDCDCNMVRYNARKASRVD
ncbi:MAG: helix-turn-helix transcriptional regulator [Planctomycetota bacterium]|jgi:predicted DNA-binding transcriptional regulator AlpA